LRQVQLFSTVDAAQQAVAGERRTALLFGSLLGYRAPGPHLTVVCL